MRSSIPPFRLLLVAAVLAWVAAPLHAWAIPYVTIQSIAKSSAGDWTPPDHLGLGTSTPGGINDIHYVNRSDCYSIIAAANPKVTISWTWQPTTISLSTSFSAVTKVAPAGKSCLETALQETDTLSACIVNGQVDYASGKTYSFDVDMRDLVGRKTTCAEGTEADATVYILVNDQAAAVGTVGTSQQVVPFKIRFAIDLAGPAAPTIGSVAAGNKNLHVSWTHPDEAAVAASYVYWAELPFDATAIRDGTVAVGKSAKLTAKEYQIKDLTNGKKYYVSVTAADARGNESNLAPLKTAAPIPVYDAWQYYKEQGGTEEGGFAPCSAGPTTAGWGWLLALLAPALLLLARRRRLLARPAGLALAVFLATIPAVREAAAESPQSGSMDLRFGRYLPQIDSAFSGAKKPYADVFSDSAWDVGLALDVAVWDGFGELSLGFSTSYWSQEGHGREQASGSASTDTTTLSVVPVSLDVVYRLNVLQKRLGIPFIPYAKLGGVYAIWWMRDAEDNIAKWTNTAGTTVEALGATGGWQGTVGLRFLLDVLEPGAARSFDIEMGVNHSYLFAEYRKLALNDFGSTKSLNLSDGIFAFGLAFDY